MSFVPGETVWLLIEFKGFKPGIPGKFEGYVKGKDKTLCIVLFSGRVKFTQSIPEHYLTNSQPPGTISFLL